MLGHHNLRPPRRHYSNLKLIFLSDFVNNLTCPRVLEMVFVIHFGHFRIYIPFPLLSVTLSYLDLWFLSPCPVSLFVHSGTINNIAFNFLFISDSLRVVMIVVVKVLVHNCLFLWLGIFALIHCCLNLL